MKIQASLAAAFALVSHVHAHSYLVKPVARENSVNTVVLSSPGCPSSTPGESTSYEAGETIDVRYWRNNHLGGFIRWAISPVGEETKENFDDNVFYYTCRESGPDCLPKGSNEWYSGDSSDANTISCGDTITLPDWLPAGDYVLQWTWFGVGSSYGNIGWSEPQFRSCADIKLTTSGSGSEPSCPTFVGGDRVTKLENKASDQCFYYYTNEIVETPYKGSNEQSEYEKYYIFGVPKDVEGCTGNSAGSASNSTTTAPSTTTATPTVTTATPSATEPETLAPSATGSDDSSAIGNEGETASSGSDDEEPCSGSYDIPGEDDDEPCSGSFEEPEDDADGENDDEPCSGSYDIPDDNSDVAGEASDIDDEIGNEGSTNPDDAYPSEGDNGSAVDDANDEEDDGGDNTGNEPSGTSAAPSTAPTTAPSTAPTTAPTIPLPGKCGVRRRA